MISFRDFFSRGAMPPLPESSAPIADLRRAFPAVVNDYSLGRIPEERLLRASFAYNLRRQGRRRLVVMLSATMAHTLQKYPFEADVLFLVDISNSYFCIPCEGIAALIRDLVRQNRYKAVDFIGCSKAGTGALSIGARTSQLLGRRACSVYAFSPQTQIYPHHPNADLFPSYKSLKPRLAALPALVPIVARNGALAALDYRRLKRCLVIFGTEMANDAFEAQRLAATPGVTLSPITTGQHYTLGFYTIPVNVDRESARQKFAEADDPDIVAVRSDDAIDEYIRVSAEKGYALSSLLH